MNTEAFSNVLVCSETFLFASELSEMFLKLQRRFLIFWGGITRSEGFAWHLSSFQMFQKVLSHSEVF